MSDAQGALSLLKRVSIRKVPNYKENIAEFDLDIYMLFAGWEVRMVKDCDIFKTEVTVSHHTDLPLAGK